MQSLRDYFRQYLSTPQVRPWGLIVPVAVVLICIPLLRPLRHPGRIGADEQMRLLTIESLADRGQLVLPATVRGQTGTRTIDGATFADQPPMLSATLVPAYRLIRWFGMDLRDNAVMVTMLLTVLCSTLPVAASGALVYRIARLFELPRKKRAALAGVTVFGSGLVSYATVLNQHAPAAALALASMGCLIHIAIARRRLGAGVWLVWSGLAAGFAAAIDPPATIVLLLLPVVILSFPWRISNRVLGVAVYAMGVVPPLLLHGVLCEPLTGTVIPRPIWPASHHAAPAIERFTDPVDWPEELPGIWDHTGRLIGRLLETALGPHGLLTHFPVVIVGVIGVMLVMHRHWPATTKSMAGLSLAAVLGGMLLYATSPRDDTDAMFACRWLIAVTPLLVFWSGVWLRTSHRPVSWTLAGIALGFSVLVTLIGTTGPMPPRGFEGYTPADALAKLILGDPQDSLPAPPPAGRP